MSYSHSDLLFIGFLVAVIIAFMALFGLRLKRHFSGEHHDLGVLPKAPDTATRAVTSATPQAPQIVTVAPAPAAKKAADKGGPSLGTVVQTIIVLGVVVLFFFFGVPWLIKAAHDPGVLWNPWVGGEYRVVAGYKPNQVKKMAEQAKEEQSFAQQVALPPEDDAVDLGPHPITVPESGCSDWTEKLPEKKSLGEAGYHIYYELPPGGQIRMRYRDSAGNEDDWKPDMKYYRTLQFCSTTGASFTMTYWIVRNTPES